jgi:hypothetical protein
VHAAGRDDKYDVRWNEMLANQGVRIALLNATSAAKMRLHEYRTLRSINPYEVARVARVRNAHFYNDTQERILNDDYPRPETKVVD